MARFVYGLQQSLDGFVDHQLLGRPGPAVFGHFLARVRASAGCVYGSRTYEIMRYWDGEEEGWDEEDRAFAEAWRAMPKWVVTRSGRSVGPNAVVVEGDVGAALREAKARVEGEIDVAGPDLARSLGALGLIDEYRLYFRPVVLGGGTRFFAGDRRALRFVGSEEIGEGVVRVSYVPV